MPLRYTAISNSYICFCYYVFHPLIDLHSTEIKFSCCKNTHVNASSRNSQSLDLLNSSYISTVNLLKCLNCAGKTEQTNAKKQPTKILRTLKPIKLTHEYAHTVHHRSEIWWFPPSICIDRTEYSIAKYSYRGVKWVRFDMELR